MGGGGGGNQLANLALIMALTNKPTPVVPQIDDAMSQRNTADTTLVRRRLASSQLAGALPDLGATRVPGAKSAASMLSGKAT